jgi:hypothetical protein
MLCWEYWDISVGLGLRIAILYKTITHSLLSLKDLYGQLSSTIDDRCSSQHIGIQISSISVEMVLYVLYYPTC